MNTVSLIGRLTRDVDGRVAGQLAVAKFTLAVDRFPKDKGTDFISCVAFGNLAEQIEKEVKKGDELGISGRIQTGSYEKDGKKIYTTDVVAEKIDYIAKIVYRGGEPKAEPKEEVAGFTFDESIPF